MILKNLLVLLILKISFSNNSVNENKCYIKNTVDEFEGNLTNQKLKEWGFNNESKIIDVASRGIISIELNAFEEFKNMEFLNLGYNKVKNIEKVFENLNNLNELNLKFNLIKHLSNESIFTLHPHFWPIYSFKQKSIQSFCL